MIIFCFVQNAAFADVTFMYLHGSNTNTQEDRQWFEKGINKIHPALKKELDKKIGTSINEQPEIFFWNYNSTNALETMQTRLNMTKSVSAPAAFLVRRALSAELHDAVWIVKSRHYLPILDRLNEQVIQEHNKGNKVVLLGYSMGTFVTYKYLLFKLRTLNPQQIFSDLKINSDFIAQHPQENTCLSALIDGNIGSINIDGKFVLNKEFEKNYLNLAQLSDRHCAPKDALLGVINYGSPLAIFSSELEDKERSSFCTTNIYSMIF